MTTLFDDKTSDEGVDYVAKAKERFSKDDAVDVEGLSKSWAHSQEHIERLEQEAVRLREDNIKRLSYEDLLAKLKPTRDASNVDVTDDTEDTGNRDTKNVDLDAMLESKLNAKLTQIQQSTIESDNRAFIKTRLQEVWGRDYVAKLKEKTQELGETEASMNEMAGRNPKLLLASLGADAPVVKQQSVSAPRSSVTFRGNTKTTSKYDEYQALKSTDPKRYNSPAYQMEMLRVADEMGDKFYSKG